MFYRYLSVKNKFNMKVWNEESLRKKTDSPENILDKVFFVCCTFFM